jgi:hypothetical protein
MEKGGASDDQPGAADAVGALGRSARAVASGTTALSRLSMLAEDRVATYAMRDRALVTALAALQLAGRRSV